jgi:hypothetical protein
VLACRLNLPKPYQNNTTLLKYLILLWKSGFI